MEICRVSSYNEITVAAGENCRMREDRYLARGYTIRENMRKLPDEGEKDERNEKR